MTGDSSGAFSTFLHSINELERHPEVRRAIEQQLDRTMDQAYILRSLLRFESDNIDRAAHSPSQFRQYVEEKVRGTRALIPEIGNLLDLIEDCIEAEILGGERVIRIQRQLRHIYQLHRHLPEMSPEDVDRLSDQISSLYELVS